MLPSLRVIMGATKRGSDERNDTVTGKHLLISQGARLIGKYDARVSFGQNRALIVWQRIIRPDGSSVVIENLPATDKSR